MLVHAYIELFQDIRPQKRTVLPTFDERKWPFFIHASTVRFEMLFSPRSTLVEIRPRY
jgi:hypothetical protein